MPTESGRGGAAEHSVGFEDLFDKAVEASLPVDTASEANPSDEVERGAAYASNRARSNPARGTSKPKPHFHDHRDRLRDKFARRGADAFDDYELLELVLFQVMPRIDTKPIAKDLIARFGNLSEVVAAPVEKLVTVKGVGPATAQHLKLLHQVSIRVGRSSVINRPVLSSWNALLDYCRAVMQFEGREQFRVLFLDRKNRLLADDLMGKGTVDRAPVYPREIVRQALVHEATAIILVHNHPSGDPTPSRQDIDLTHAIVQTAKAIDVVVHDHLIVGRDDVASFKMLGLL
ncbi:MAG: DNA repair protein RadC [Litorimonas sp.]